MTDQPTGAIASLPGANTSFREYYDIVSTYKINDNLTTTNELNFVHDDLFHASAGGAAQYLVYTLNDQWSLGGRIEAFADQGKPATTASPASPAPRTNPSTTPMGSAVSRPASLIAAAAKTTT